MAEGKALLSLMKKRAAITVYEPDFRVLRAHARQQINAPSSASC